MALFFTFTNSSKSFFIATFGILVAFATASKTFA